MMFSLKLDLNIRKLRPIFSLRVEGITSTNLSPLRYHFYSSEKDSFKILHFYCILLIFSVASVSSVLYSTLVLTIFY